jgi:hypothetical protein
MNDRL